MNLFGTIRAPRELVFGSGQRHSLGRIVGKLGRRALVVSDARLTADPDFVAMMADLERQGIAVAVDGSVLPDVPVELAQASADAARAFGPDLVIGIGGGSCLDMAKCVAVLLAHGGRPQDYYAEHKVPGPVLPLIAIPTTAGTGAEVTRNAVLVSPEHRLKVSLRHPLMLPRLAIIDPELTYGLPQTLTAATGLDALTQLIEPFTCNRATPVTDALCREAIPLAARSLQRACENPDPTARVDMALASLHGGLALANSGLGAVHGFAAPIGGMFEAPHGAICAALLPHVMAANLKTMTEQGLNIDRYIETARLLTSDPKAGAADGIDWVKTLVATLKIPSLGSYGITREDFPDIAEKALTASSIKANPVNLNQAELTSILYDAL